MRSECLIPLRAPQGWPLHGAACAGRTRQKDAHGEGPTSGGLVRHLVRPLGPPPRSHKSTVRLQSCRNQSIAQRRSQCPSLPRSVPMSAAVGWNVTCSARARRSSGASETDGARSGRGARYGKSDPIARDRSCGSASRSCRPRNSTARPARYGCSWTTATISSPSGPARSTGSAGTARA